MSEEITKEQLKDLQKQARLFKSLLYGRINSIRPNINVDLSKQKRGIRFNDNQFVFDKIIVAVQDFKENVTETFNRTNPVEFIPSAVEDGSYDQLIIDTLHVCSVADHMFDNDVKYH